ncbi:uncharacterized protein N7498_004495 [Penicillium cinerascens]|uniref:Uncharacterized protein n=1 Tax=Penicillium cinerascens TaxID=70096 RepID=A0A9W9SZH8_9EURO|nr:uncharacterized protein N7498_004495 [Penicillium cinerascens]KAJ5203616.1 hypothetical protein N7498_004495 [Penicillium cinerascens]
MAQVKKNPNFQRYLDLSKADLKLPSLTEDNKGYCTIEVGERYCRVEDCGNATLFTSTNNLRKHVQKQHPEVSLTGEEFGGRLCQADEFRAIEFFNEIMEAYDEREAAKEEILPKLPLKNDRSVHITKMRQTVRSMKLPVPCEVCKDTDQPKLCCHDEVKGTCEHFGLFTDPRNQQGQEYVPSEDEA